MPERPCASTTACRGRPAPSTIPPGPSSGANSPPACETYGALSHRRDGRTHLAVRHGARSQAVLEKRADRAAVGGAIAVTAVVPTGKSCAASPGVRGRQIVVEPNDPVPVAAVVGESLVRTERRAH